MKYVFVTYNASFEVNSPEDWLKRTRGYAGILKCLGKANTIINIKQIDFEGEYLHNGVQYRFVNFGKKKTYFPWRLHRFVKKMNADVVFVQGLHNPLQLIQLAMRLSKKTKIIVQHHAEKPFTGSKKYVQRLASRYIDACLFASEAIGQEWVKKGNLASSGKIREVMEISSVFYPVEKGLAMAKTKVTGHPVFLWVGRLNENKDPLNVIRAFLQFVQSEPSARLYMIYHTDDLLQQAKDIISNSINKDSIVLVGKVPGDDLLYWYNSADFIVSGSYYEGSGTAICEAMSCGCIPIVTDIFSFRMITDNGKCGILYEPGNETALLQALMQTKTLDKEEMSNRSLLYFNKNLSFDAIAGRIHDIASAL